MLDIYVLEAQVLELHGRELQDELGLARGILISDLLDLAQDETFHFYRMEAKSLGELEPLLEGDDPRFKKIAAREALVHFRVFDRVVFVGKKIGDYQAFFVPGPALEPEERMSGLAEIPEDIELLVGEPVLVSAEPVLDGGEIDPRQVSVKKIPVHEDRHSLFELDVIFVNDARLLKILLLGVEDLAVVLACGEFFDDGLKVTLVHDCIEVCSSPRLRASRVNPKSWFWTGLDTRATTPWRQGFYFLLSLAVQIPWNRIP